MRGSQSDSDSDSLISCAKKSHVLYDCEHEESGTSNDPDTPKLKRKTNCKK